MGSPPRVGWKKEREMRESVNNMVMQEAKMGMKMMVMIERMMMEWVYKEGEEGEEMMRIKMLMEDKREEMPAKWMEKMDKVKRVGEEERDKGG
jgi:hypothetical protein